MVLLKMVERLPPILALLAAVALSGNAMGEPPQSGAEGAPKDPTGPIQVEKLDSQYLENAFVVGERIVSGGRPEGEESLKELSRLGVRTIINVDGSAGPAKEAQQLGIQYIHLPIGYDGVPRKTVAAMAAVMERTQGRIYLHCHHGKHRGPAAVAALLAATEQWQLEACLDWMHQAGTASKYHGLFEDVRSQTPMTREETAAIRDVDLPAVAKVPERVAQMAKIDELFDAVKKSKPGGSGSRKQKEPSGKEAEKTERIARAALFVEGLRELRRNETTEESYLEMLECVVHAAEELEKIAQAATEAGQEAISNEREADANWAKAISLVEQQCSACHAVYRDDPRHSHEPQPSR